jgi:transcriptional regulator with XRE-family HTH domain
MRTSLAQKAPFRGILMTDPKDKKFDLDQYIGMKVKKARMDEGLKLVDVARISGISQGMVSKIENAQVSTSLETLSRLCDAIGLPISKLFTDYDRPDGGAQFTKAGEGLEVVRRGTEKGHTYQLLTYKRGGKTTFEPFMVSMDDLSEVFPTFSHPGEEFIYLVSGKLVYRHGNHLYEMEAGDSLTFDAEVPHGPERLEEVPIKLLSIINYSDD